MKRDKFQEVKDAASAYNDAIYLAVSNDDNPFNHRRKSVWVALENIYTLTKLQPYDWFEALRIETMDNLLTIHPYDRPLVMKETIHGLFDSFAKPSGGYYTVSDLEKIEEMETLDVSLYSYNVKIMDCLIPDHYTVDYWRISEMNEDIREYLECIGILAQDMMSVLQDIVGEGSFEARDGNTGLSLFGDESPTTDGERGKPDKHPKTKGRPRGDFKNRMIDDADGKKLQKIQALMRGRMGKDAVLVIYSCMVKGWLLRPTYSEVKDEFGDVVSKSVFNDYWSRAANAFLQADIDRIKSLLVLE